MRYTKILPISDRKIHWLAGCLILLTGVFSFGISMSGLGLYGIHWANILESLPVPSGYFLEGSIQYLLIGLFGKASILYHLTNLVLWTLCGYLFFLTQTRAGIRSMRALAGAILFLVFPAFIQPGAAFELTPVLAGLCLAFLAIEFYFNALSKARITIWKLAIGAGLGLLAVFSSPVVAILSAIIALVVIIGLVFFRKKLKPTALIIGTAHFLIPLVILILKIHPGQPGLSFVSIGLKQFLNSLILSWRQIIAMPESGEKTALYLVILLLAAVLLVYGLTRIKISDKNEVNAENTLANRDLILILGLILAGLLYFFLNAWIRVSIDSRDTLEAVQVTAGIIAALLVSSMVELLFMEKYQAAILALIIVLSAGTRYQVTGQYVKETGRVTGFIQQLAIRSDSFEPGTRLVVEQLPFDHTTRLSLQALIRAEYDLSAQPELFALIPADDNGFREFMQNDSEQSVNLRIDKEEIRISKDTILGVWQPAGRCIEFIDRTTDRKSLPQGLALAANHSNPTLIRTDKQLSGSNMRGLNFDPVNEWCTTVQYAYRLAQNAQWDLIDQAYNAAQKKNLNSKYYMDYVPLLSAYIQEEKYQDAVKLSQSLNTDSDAQKSLCKQWTQILLDNTLSKEVVTEAQKAQSMAGCE